MQYIERSSCFTLCYVLLQLNQVLCLRRVRICPENLNQNCLIVLLYFQTLTKYNMTTSLICNLYISLLTNIDINTK